MSSSTNNSLENGSLLEKTSENSFSFETTVNSPDSTPNSTFSSSGKEKSAFFASSTSITTTTTTTTTTDTESTNCFNDDVTEDNGEEEEVAKSKPGNEHKYSLKDFKILKKLGNGAEGQVFLATKVASEDGDEHYAIKSIKCNPDEELAHKENELSFLVMLDHKNIVKHVAYWYEVVERQFIGPQAFFYLVMEYCEISLEEIIAQRKSQNLNFEVSEMLSWAYQLADCMCYLHSQGYIHRDIKPENILLKNNGKSLKLCDFGFTKNRGSELAKTFVGTVVYMAPEIFESRKYDESIDIWSLGVVLLQLAIMKTQNQMIMDIKKQVSDDKHFIKKLLDGHDQRIISICENCLSLDPVERPTAQELASFLSDKSATIIRKQSFIASSVSMPIADSNSSPLTCIQHYDGKRFWVLSGWGGKNEVSWLDFCIQYKMHVKKRINKDQERGLKTLLLSHVSDGIDYVSCHSFNNAITSSGFPFDESILYAIEKFRETRMGENGESNVDYSKPMAEEQYQEARKDYLDMITGHDKIFVDPISQQVLNVDQHCAPLRLVSEEEWEELMQNEHDMDHEDDKLIRLERLGQHKEEKYENAINYLASIKCGHRYIILGAAAAGKTCMMKLLMFKAAKKALENEEYLIPIFVPICNLGSIAQDKNIDNFKLNCIRASADSMYNKSLKYPDHIEHFLMESMRRQKILFLFDGLDEASSIDEKNMIQHRIVYMQTDKIGVIITSRVSGFDKEQDLNMFDDYSVARVLPLTYDTQRRIAEMRGIKDALFFQLLKGKYNELGKTPLLLSLMIQEFKQSKTLPEIRAELYKRAINTMIDIYFQKARPDLTMIEDRKVEKKVLKKFLGILAIYLHKKRKRDFLPKDLEKGVLSPDLDKVWNRLRQDVDIGKFSLLIKINTNYRFAHLTFQEYFVARNWADPKKESSIRQMERQWIGLGSRMNFSSESLRKLIIDPWYRETFLLCSGKMEKDDFLKFGNFLTKLYRKQSHIIDSILFNMIRERPPKEEEQYKDLIKYLNSERKLRVLLQGLIHESEDLRQMALKRVKLYKKYLTITSFLTSQFDSEFDYAAESLSLLIPREDKETLDKLISELDSKSSPRKRSRIAFVLGNIAELGSKDVCDKLKELLDDPSDIVANAACESLCKIGIRGEKELVEKLTKLLGNKNIQSTASRALGCLADKGDQLVIEKLSGIASTCDEALLAIGKIAYKGDEKVIDKLISILQQSSVEESKTIEALELVVDKSDNEKVINSLIDTFGKMRRTIAIRAAKAVGSVCEKGDKSVIDRLLKMLEQKAIRDKAVIALGEAAEKGNEEVINALINVLSDKGGAWAAREQAVISLSKLGKRGDRKILSALLQRLGDQNEVINAAADALCIISDKDNKEVLEGFKKLTKHPDSGVVEKAVQILGKVTSRGNDDITQLLLNILQSTGDYYETVRTTAAESLGFVTDPSSKTVIKFLLSFVVGNYPDYLRSACVCSIGNIITDRKNVHAASTTEELFQQLIKEHANSLVRGDIINVLAKICDVGGMIEKLKNKSLKSMGPIIFTVIVKAIRVIRDDDPNWKLAQEHVDVLQRQKSLESMFVFFESAG